jgi:hypothetical protein
MGGQWEPEWVDEHGTIHQGEIVGPTPRRRGGSPITDEDLIRAVIDARVQGRGLVDIATEYGVSHETVRRWCGEAEKGRRTQIDVVGLRIEAAQHLEAARRSAWELYRTGRAVQAPGVMRDALNQVNALTTTHSKLMGLNMPVRVDVQVTELSQAEQELQEMINEAKAEAAAKEQAVIDAADADPDL